MNLYEKLLVLQKSVDVVAKDAINKTDKYGYVSSSAVLEIVRPKMDELGLLLFTRIKDTVFREGETRSGTARFLTEINYDFVWHDVESGEELTIPWYAQGDDLAGPKGPGKAVAYAEKTFLLKQFHVPTDKDDPDSDGRTQIGELRQRGTNAEKETAEAQRMAISAMLAEAFPGDAEGQRNAIIASTKNEARRYPGVATVGEISDRALPVVYSKIAKAYERKIGHPYTTEENK